MNIEAILQTSLDHPDLEQAWYWTTNPTDVEIMSFNDTLAGYLITHQTEALEICLVTAPAKAFVRCRQTGAYLERRVSRPMCDEVQAYFGKKGGENIG